MPLRVTIELIPGGNEARKRTLAVMNIERDEDIKFKDGKEYGNYSVIKMYHDDPTGGYIEPADNVERDPNPIKFLKHLLNKLH